MSPLQASSRPSPRNHINLPGVRTFILILLCWHPAIARAQDPELAESDLAFSREVVQKYHFVAWVDLELQENQFTHYQYDRYPNNYPETKVERIKGDEGVFVRPEGKAWVKSEDWGKTGSPVPDDQAQKLDMYVNVIDAQLAQPVNLDPTQGTNVWKYVGRSNDKTFTYYTYVRTREHPKPNGIYPKYTFMKAATDTDGRLFLSKATGQLRSGETRIPVTVRMTYLIPLPPNTKLEVFDKATGKKKYQTVTGRDSGWEITTQQSAPPP